MNLVQISGESFLTPTQVDGWSIESHDSPSLSWFGIFTWESLEAALWVALDARGGTKDIGGRGGP